MIHIEKDFAGRGIDSLADLVRLRNFAEEHSGVVAVWVEGLENHYAIRILEDIGHGFEAVDDVSGLIIPGEAKVIGAGDDSHVLCADTLGTGNSILGFLFKVGAGFFAAQSVNGFAPFGVSNEDAHFDFEVAHFLPEFFLHVGRVAHHAVIFPGVESLIGGKLELIEWIFAGVIFEHAEVRGVFELESSLVGHGRIG